MVSSARSRARPGDPVRSDQLVIALEDQDLKLEREKWSAEAAQLDKQYRDALTKDDAAQIVMARSKLEQAQVQFELASRQLERRNCAHRSTAWCLAAIGSRRSARRSSVARN